MNKSTFADAQTECLGNIGQCSANCSSWFAANMPPSNDYSCEAIAMANASAMLNGNGPGANNPRVVQFHVAAMDNLCRDGVESGCRTRDSLHELLTSATAAGDQRQRDEARSKAIRAKLAEAKRLSASVPSMGLYLSHQVSAENAITRGDLATAEREADAALDAANKEVADAKARDRATADALAAQQNATNARQNAIDTAKAECDADMAKCQTECASSTTSEKCPYLATVLFSGVKTLHPDVPRAVEVAKRSCDAGNQRGCATAGAIQDMPADCSDEPSCKAKCDGGWGNACVAWGHLYVDGDGVPKSLARANALFKRACDLASAKGCFTLAAAYIEGIGVPKNIAAAHDPLVKACDLGEKLACQTYCSMLGLNRTGDNRCYGR